MFRYDVRAHKCALVSIRGWQHERTRNGTDDGDESNDYNKNSNIKTHNHFIRHKRNDEDVDKFEKH